MSLYPPEKSELNLNRIETLKEYGVNVGYSSHYTDWYNTDCVYAMKAGAKYIEKHFHLEGTYSPISHIAIKEPQFKLLKQQLKDAELMFGDGNINMQPREKQSKEHYRGRFIV